MSFSSLLSRWLVEKTERVTGKWAAFGIREAHAKKLRDGASFSLGHCVWDRAELNVDSLCILNIEPAIHCLLGDISS